MSSEVPSVLAVLVVTNGAAWIERVLASLARQTHGRLGVLAVDNGSTDGSLGILQRVLGHRRVLRIDEPGGFPAAVRRALQVPAAREADHVLLMHDDVVLAPDAVARLVEASAGEQVAVVGPKVLDWERPGVLREVGCTADRFGYPSTPLEDDEIDQGQYDAPRDVLFVTSAAMLVAREAWTRIDGFDERLAPGDADLDLCWRIRLAGFRVVVSPRAMVLHRTAGVRGERHGPPDLGERYRVERSGLLSLLKNYRLVTLAWILPLYAVQGLARLLLYLVSRRLDRAGQIIRAWGWNVTHLPGTLSRRIRAQSLRRVRDRDVTALMAPAGTRLSRWTQHASSLLVSGRAGPLEPGGEEPDVPPLRQRVAGLFTSHPVAIGWIAAAAMTLFAFRGVLFVSRIEGGLFPVFPDGPADFFRTFASGWRPTGLGGTVGGSPALVPLGIGSVLALGDPQLLGRLMVALTPILGAASMYASVRRLGAPRVSGVVAAGCYGLSALTLWTASEGSLPAMAAVVTLPWVGARVARAFSDERPGHPFRWMVGTGIGMALGASFFPSLWLAVALVAIPFVLLPDRGGRRDTGLALTAGAAAAAAVLLFPFVMDVILAGGATEVGATAVPDFLAMLRTSPGPAPGAWPAAAFLPLAALFSFTVIETRGTRGALRAMATAVAGVFLAWLAAAGHLPPPFANPLAYLVAAAFSMCVLVAFGTRSVVPEMRQAAFGYRQIVVGGLTLLVGLGVAAQAIQALGGSWAVGEDRVPPAWPVVSSTRPRGEPFRVLWLGPEGGEAFPPPGGEPEGVVAAGRASVAYGITGRSGRSVLAVGLPASGGGDRHLREVLGAMLSGRVLHGGALLGALGVRYLVTPEEGMPPLAVGRLEEQIDMNLVQREGGLRIYRNAAVLPEAAVVPGAEAVATARSPSLLAPVDLDPATAATLSTEGDAWVGPAGGPSLVALATTYDPAWTLTGPDGEVGAFPSFGWGVGFGTEGGAVAVRFEGQLPRTIEIIALGVLWLGALWVVRRRAADRPAEVPVREAAADLVAPIPARARRLSRT